MSGGERPRLILASNSPRRFELLSAAGFCPEVRAPEVEELTDQGGVGAEELVRQNARLKGRAVFDHGTELGTIVVAADTVVELDGRIFGKPGSVERAVQMLMNLVGKTHRVFTGVWMGQRSRSEVGVRFEEWVECTEVSFRARDERRVRAYAERVGASDKAGGYAAQIDDGEMIESFRGSVSSVIGLPMERVADVLERWGT